MNNRHPVPGLEELGYFGNIWVRQNYLPNIGDTAGGHFHYFDHVTLLSNGSVEISVDNEQSKIFTAPTFIVIRKDKRHKITALEPDTYYYCVFALRDIEGNQTDVFNEDNDPWFAAAASKDFWKERGSLENLTKDEVVEDQQSIINMIK